MRILVVDDSKKNRVAAVDQLTAALHSVLALSDYTAAVEKVKETKPDVALLDLLMPAEAMTLGPEGQKYLGESICVGYPLAIKLALERVPLIAVATDTNHHNHPASAIMDWLSGEVISIGASKVVMMHAPMTDEGVKDWVKILTRLTRV
jgi:CheY-like chemotaxis protein